MRELDLILEAYLDRHAATLDQEKSDVFARFLESTDMDLYAWVTGRELPQDADFREILADMKNHPELRD